MNNYYNYSTSVYRSVKEGETVPSNAIFDEDGDILVKTVNNHCYIAKSAFLLDGKYSAARTANGQGAAATAAREAIRTVVKNMDTAGCVKVIEEVIDATQLSKKGLGGRAFQEIHEMFTIEANRVILVDLAKRLGFENPQLVIEVLVPKPPEQLVVVLQNTEQPTISHSVLVEPVQQVVEHAAAPVKQKAVIVKQAKQQNTTARPPSPAPSTSSESESAPSTPSSRSSNSSRSSLD